MIKKLFYYFVFILLASCAVKVQVPNTDNQQNKKEIPKLVQSDEPKKPSWYDKPNLFSKENRNILVGFGFSGDNEQSAKNQAIANIQTQIRTTILAENECQQKVITQEGRESYTRECSQKIKEITQGTLSGITPEKRENINGFYFAAFSYDISPAYQKIAKKLKAQSFDCNSPNIAKPIRKFSPKASNSNQKSDDAFIELEAETKKLNKKKENIDLPATKISKLQIPFANNLKESIGCEVNWSLNYNESLEVWQVNLNQQNINQNLISLSLKQFLPIANEGVTFGFQVGANPSKKVKETDEYFINLEINKNGYLSLFNIESSGIAIVLEDNKQVAKSQKIQFPDSSKYNGLNSKIRGQENAIEEYFLAVVCENKINLNFFLEIETDLVSEEHLKYNYGELLRLLKETQACHANSNFIVVER